MYNNIIAKNTTVTEGIESYVNTRFKKFEKFVPPETTVRTKIEVKDGGNRHKVEVTITANKKVFRVESNDKDMYAAIDDAQRTMLSLLKKNKEKLIERHRGGSCIDETDEPAPVAPKVVARSKIHVLDEMTVNEACDAMDLVGHTFYAYRDIESGFFSIVYKRNNGTIGNLTYLDR